VTPSAPLLAPQRPLMAHPADSQVQRPAPGPTAASSACRGASCSARARARPRRPLTPSRGASGSTPVGLDAGDRPDSGSGSTTGRRLDRWPLRSTAAAGLTGRLGHAVSTSGCVGDRARRPAGLRPRPRAGVDGVDRRPPCSPPASTPPASTHRPPVLDLDIGRSCHWSPWEAPQRPPTAPTGTKATPLLGGALTAPRGPPGSGALPDWPRAASASTGSPDVEWKMSRGLRSSVPR